MRTILAATLCMFALGCDDELKSENAKLKNEVTRLRTEMSTRKTGNPDLWTRADKADKLINALHASADDLVHNAMDAIKPNGTITIEANCKEKAALQEYTRAVVRYRLLEQDPSLRLIANLTPALLEALSDGGEAELSKLKAPELVGSALAHELLAYHDKITAVTVWEAKLVQIRRQVEVQGEHYPWLSQLSTQSFYDAGFPKSQDECLLQEGFSFAQGDRSFSSADSPEFWFYSFWFRRYHEGRFEVTAKLLQMLVGPSAAPLAPGPAEK